MSLYRIRKNKKGEKITLKGNKNPQEIFYESTLKLFHLLANHPHFIAGVAKLRKKYKLPYSEITDISKLLVWQHSNKKIFDTIRRDVGLSKLLSDFMIPRELQSATFEFMLDFIPTNNIIKASHRDTGLNVIRPSKKADVLELNLGIIYLEITPYTAMREVKDRWNIIVNGRKEIRNYGIPATTREEEKVWKMHLKGESTKAITKQMNNDAGRVRYGESEILTLKNNYKKALSKLRKVD